MNKHLLSTIAMLAFTAVSGAALAAEAGLQITLGTTADFERRTLNYDCGTDTPLTVTYLNAAPNFLAIVPVEGEAEPLIFASAISASGARYVSGQWVWWTKGPEAQLFDETLGEDAEAVSTCSEIVNTP